jgi:hypothetical protein
MLGQGLAFVPNYNTAKIAAGRMFRLMDRKPRIYSPQMTDDSDWVRGILNSIYTMDFFIDILLVLQYDQDMCSEAKITGFLLCISQRTLYTVGYLLSTLLDISQIHSPFSVLFWFTNKMILDDLYDDDDVNGLRLCL